MIETEDDWNKNVERSNMYQKIQKFSIIDTVNSGITDQRLITDQIRIFE